jgi:hypothetical protein
VRVILDLVRTADNRVAGTVTCDQAEPASFHGWLELMRLLEAVDADAPRGAVRSALTTTGLAHHPADPT